MSRKAMKEYICRRCERLTPGWRTQVRGLCPSCYKYVLQFGGRDAYPLDYPQMSHSVQPSISDRNREIYVSRTGGKTLAAIATQYGITRERVRQICIRVAAMTEAEAT